MKDISGKFYDWKITLKPEREYIHDYTKTFTYKLLLADRNRENNGSIVYHTFEETLKIIEEVDKMTFGMPKIVYLVGWQFFGHDSKYPAWNSVNEALKRGCDKSAYESLLWLMEEGFKFNTTVSLHINIQDAYKDSPLWDEYVKNDLIALNKDGTLLKGDVWNNEQCYIISYKQEWDKGFIQKRIDELCEFLPIERAGTIHIDAMHAKADPGHGWTLEDIQVSRNKIVRYWRDKGVDVTTEFLYYEASDWRYRYEQLIGLVPLFYHFSQNLDEYIDRPGELIMGVNVSNAFKEGLSSKMDRLFGGSFNAEGIINGENYRERFFEEFCKNEVRYRYLLSLKREEAVVRKGNICAIFSDGVVTDMNDNIEKNGIKLQNENYIFLPAVFMKNEGYFLYVLKSGEYEIDMYRAFGINDTTFKAENVSECGEKKEEFSLKVKDGILKVSGKEKEAFILIVE